MWNKGISFLPGVKGVKGAACSGLSYLITDKPVHKFG